MEKEKETATSSKTTSSKTTTAKKTTAAKKTTTAKPKTTVAKKTTTAKPKTTTAKPKTETKVEVKLPEFETLQDVKNFCVATGLNRVDGYVLMSKKNKKELTDWVKSNAHLIKDADTIKNIPNPHSPSSGLGDMSLPKSNIPVEKKPLQKEQLPEKAHVKNSQNIAYSTVTQETVVSDMPTAISENDKAMNFGKPSTEVEKVEESDSNNIDKSIKDMKNYAESLLQHIKTAPSTIFHGGFKMAEYNQMILSADKSYKYDLQHDNNGKFIIMSNSNGDSIRVPESGYINIQ